MTISNGRWPFPSISFNIQPTRTALLIIDMQYLDAHPDYGIGKAMEAAEPGSGDYYFGQLSHQVIPNIQRLLSFFRANELCVLYLTLGSEFEDGRDLSPLRRAKFAQRQRQTGCSIPLYRGHFEYQILPELKPEPGEPVIMKTTPGAFASTNLDQLLRNLGIESLLITGVVTDSCVESTARGAVDRGYKCIIVSDACAAHEAAAHQATLHSFQKYFGRTEITEAILAELIEDIPKNAESAT